MMTIFLSLLAVAGSCPKGNLKACQKYLQEAHQSDQGQKFAEKYNEVCGQNKSFSCIKVIVRGDVKAELKEQAKFRGPKAQLYPVKLNEENYIFVLSSK